MKLLTFLVLLLVLLLYAFIGGLIFRAIEIDHEHDLKVEANSTLNGIIGSNACLNVSDVMDLGEIIVEMNANSIFLLSNGTPFFRPGFSIRSSILISCGLYAGFGIKNDVPVTIGGKIFTAFYSIFTGFYYFFVMYVMGDLLDIVLQFLCNRMMERCGRNRRGANTTSCFYKFRQLILLVVGFIFFIVIPAAIVHSIEFWSFGDCLYFCIIYVYTIGFGDFSPGMREVKGQSEDFVQWYRMFIGFWLLIAIMWFAIVIFQFNSYITGFAWRTTENIIDGRVDEVKDSFVKNKIWNSIRSVSRLRPLPPLPKLPSTSSSPQTLPPPLHLPPLPPMSSSSSPQSTSSSRTLITDEVTFPRIPNFSMNPQESRGDVSVIKF